MIEVDEEFIDGKPGEIQMIVDQTI